MIITRTPYSFTLMGAGTDRPDWFVHNGGVVIGASINHYVTLMAQRVPEGERIYYRKMFDDKILKRYELDFPFDALDYQALPDCQFDRDAALKTGLTNALFGLKNESAVFDGLALSSWILSGDCDKRLGPTNHILSSWGGLNVIRYHRGLGHTVFPNLCTRAGELARRLCLIKLPIQDPSVEESLLQYDPLTTQTIQLLTERGINALHKVEWGEFGVILDDAWRLERNCSPYKEVSIDQLYAKARVHGACGGRLLNESTLVLYIPDPANRGKVLKSLGEDVKVLPFEIGYDGSRIVFNQ